MKRLLFLFLAIALLAQWTYATAGGYCTHEAVGAGAVAHWGHHVHEHDPDMRDGDSSSGSSSGFDLDCSFCHAAASSTLDTSTRTVLYAPAAEALQSTLEPPDFRSRSPDLPDRPKWSERLPA